VTSFVQRKRVLAVTAKSLLEIRKQKPTLTTFTTASLSSRAEKAASPPTREGIATADPRKARHFKAMSKCLK
jgi:hypothetical protein